MWVITLTGEQLARWFRACLERQDSYSPVKTALVLSFKWVILTLNLQVGCGVLAESES